MKGTQYFIILSIGQEKSLSVVSILQIEYENSRAISMITQGEKTIR